MYELIHEESLNKPSNRDYVRKIEQSVLQQYVNPVEYQVVPMTKKKKKTHFHLHGAIVCHGNVMKELLHDYGVTMTEKMENLLTIRLTLEDKSRVFITRHGNSVANEWGRHGHFGVFQQIQERDSSLTLYGSLSALYRGYNYLYQASRVYVSPLLRTWETAVALYAPMAQQELVLEVRKELQEFDTTGLGLDGSNHTHKWSEQIHKFKLYLEYLYQDHGVHEEFRDMKTQLRETLDHITIKVIKGKRMAQYTWQNKHVHMMTEEVDRGFHDSDPIMPVIQVEILRGMPSPPKNLFNKKTLRYPFRKRKTRRSSTSFNL